MKYTKDLLAAAVLECASVAGVLRKLGIAPAGGTHAHISRKIKAFGIDTSHFLGKAANRSPNHKGSKKHPWQETLVLRLQGRRQKSHVLRRALIESGSEYRCQVDECGLRGQWLGKLLMLHVNHKNGNWLDDRPENLEFLCPNCHCQTLNYCGNKGLSRLTTTSWGQKRGGPVAELADAYGLGP